MICWSSKSLRTASQSLIGMEMLQIFFFHVQPDDAGRDKRHLVVPRQQRQIFAAVQQVARHAVRLVCRLDE